MIDLNILRKEPEKIAELIKKKDPSYDVDRLIELDKQVRKFNLEIENLRSKKNELAKLASSGITVELREESIQVSKELKIKEDEFEKIQKDFKKLYLFCPNIIQDDVPKGNKESNLIVKVVGKKPEFNFRIKNHLELIQNLGWVDFQAASKMVGSRFVLYKNDAVKLMYSLTMLMLKNNINHGFEPVLPPYLVNGESLEVAGNFPKFQEEVYSVTDDSLYLIPTSEVSLTNIYKDHVFTKSDLPIRMTSWTSCFRREAGTYGSAEHGLIRIHQFEKVELYTICSPEKSQEEQDRMLICAEDILNQLGLHYRVSLLAAQDTSFQSAKTYDIEVWLPGQNAYYEVSSCSNCTDFQSRRGAIRFKNDDSKNNQLVHTLNCSSLALPRLIVALVETYQKEDGTIEFPEVLKNFII